MTAYPSRWRPEKAHEEMPGTYRHTMNLRTQDTYRGFQIRTRRGQNYEWFAFAYDGDPETNDPTYSRSATSEGGALRRVHEDIDAGYTLVLFFVFLVATAAIVLVLRFGGGM